MRALLIKDVRQTLMPTVLAWGLLLAPPVIVLAMAWFGTDPNLKRDFRRVLGMTFAMGSVAAILAASSIAGVAFAKERRERTAEFLGTTPIARWKVVLSKAIVALLMSLVPIAVGVGASVWLSASEPRQTRLPMDSESVHMNVIFASCWVGLFGLGWLFSTFFKGEVLASALPLFLVIAGVFAISWATEGHSSAATLALVMKRVVLVVGGVGCVGLIVGTLIALWRRSP